MGWGIEDAPGMRRFEGRLRAVWEQLCTGGPGRCQDVRFRKDPLPSVPAGPVSEDSALRMESVLAASAAVAPLAGPGGFTLGVLACRARGHTAHATSVPSVFYYLFFWLILTRRYFFH